MKNKLLIVILIALLVGGGILWYSSKTTEDIENNTNLPDNVDIEAPEEESDTEDENGKMTVKVYFNNSDLNPEGDCSNVFSVEREIEETEGVARKALNLLIEGPTEAEKEEGYLSSVNSDTMINSLEIEEGVAYVDFSEELDKEVGGSCMVQAIESQIKNTLKQFASVSNVEISVEGETETILQP